MKELLDLINEFQNLKGITGTSKTSSYGVSLYFDPWSDAVSIELGGYDVGNWSRHEYLNTTRENLLVDLRNKIEDAKREVEIGLKEGYYE